MVKVLMTVTAKCISKFTAEVLGAKDSDNDGLLGAREGPALKALVLGEKFRCGQQIRVLGFLQLRCS